MRVVAGSARGRRLIAPPGLSTRPTSDRVRESLFNMLDSLGGVAGATVADVFAGTGALGIEALSRGAASAVFVETDPAALKAISTNLDHTGLATRATVARLDALVWARSAGPFDLVVADPPYVFDAWDDLLEAVDATTLVLESDRQLDAGARFRLLRVKRYGSTVVHVAQRADALS